MNFLQVSNRLPKLFSFTNDPADTHETHTSTNTHQAQPEEKLTSIQTQNGLAINKRILQDPSKTKNCTEASRTQISISEITVDSRPDAFPVTTVSIKNKALHQALIAAANNVKQNSDPLAQNFGSVILRKNMYVLEADAKIPQSIIRFVTDLGQNIFDSSGQLKRNSFLYDGLIPFFIDNQASDQKAIPHIDIHRSDLYLEQSPEIQNHKGKLLTVLIRLDKETPGAQVLNGTKFFDHPSKEQLAQCKVPEPSFDLIQSQKSFVSKPDPGAVTITFFDTYCQWHEIEAPNSWQSKNSDWERHGIQLFLFSPSKTSIKDNWSYENSLFSQKHPDGFNALSEIRLKKQFDEKSIMRLVSNFPQKLAIAMGKKPEKSRLMRAALFSLTAFTTFLAIRMAQSNRPRFT